MKRTLFLRAAALAVVLLWGTTARANLINWGYQTAVFPGSVSAGSTSHVTLSPESFHNAAGDTNIVAASLQTFSGAPHSNPDVFTSSQGKYTIKITLTDTDSSTSGFLLFKGQLQGNLSVSSANVTNTFFAPTSLSIGLGNNLYTVTMGSYSPPGPPTDGNLGSIGASVTVRPLKQLVPEPTSLALAGLGFGLAGLTGWKRRRRAA
jgi:hypothetical protein